MKLYRGYISLDGKSPLMKWKRETVPDDGLLTLKQADVYSDYGAPLAEETALIDIDETAQAEKLYTIVRSERLKCRVIQTDRGLHFIFANKAKGITKCGSHLRFAVGLAGDVKVGLTNSYEKLKSKGVVRQCIYGRDLTDTDQLDEVPMWLRVIGRAGATVDFPSMQEGDGRNTELYNLSFNLQKRGFKKDDVETTCRLLNDFVFDDPLPDDEFRLVTREESMKVDPVFSDEDLEDIEDDRRWMLEQLDKTEKGKLKNTITNAEILIKMDKRFDSVRKNIMADQIEVGKELPWVRSEDKNEWTDDDDSQLRKYLERFGLFSKQNVMDALTVVAGNRAYHPVRDYLKSLPPWDGVERADRFFCTFLGAEDTPYVRAVTRKTLCGAVMRVFNPGCKFDTILVLNGGQGLGKSSCIHILSCGWFADSLKIADLQTKAAVENIQGVWLVEIAELTGLKKADVELVRSFVTRQDDYGRNAYGRRAVHKPRQCVFFGTTNAQEQGFLRDIDGNRRFWVIDVPDEGGERTTVGERADLFQDEVDQIWAEIMVRVKDGEKLYLTDPDIIKEAENIQNRSIEADPRQCIIERYLETPIPTDWYDKWSPEERVRYFKYHEWKDGSSEELQQRQYVTYIELWTEALGGAPDRVRMEQANLAAMMKRIGGWVREKKAVRIGGISTGCFRRDPITPGLAKFR